MIRNPIYGKKIIDVPNHRPVVVRSHLNGAEVTDEIPHVDQATGSWREIEKQPNDPMLFIVVMVFMKR